MTLQPTARNMLILPLETEESSVSGIVIPSFVNESNLSRGKVVHVSPELSHKFKEGDIVLYNTSSPYSQIYRGVLHLWLFEREYDSDIWAIEKQD